MDMMETIELEDLKAQARQVLEELMEAARLKPGRILVVGCSSSEIDSFKIGSHSSAEIGMAVYTALYQELKPKGIYLAAQCCEHLNRALILEAEAAQAYGYADVVYAWPIAEIAVMGAESAAKIVLKNASKKMVQQYKNDYENQFLNPYEAASHGFVTSVILPEETRHKILEALEILNSKNQEFCLKKKHGNMPV